jgi:Tol biopolymer transport system component
MVVMSTSTSLTRCFRSVLLIGLATSLAGLCAAGQTQGPLPLRPTRTAQFTIHEGTWMSMDVSPDGRRIVFDLLGHLYTVPIEGGKATRITKGMGFDGQPRYSPDGKWIIFTSDRSGLDDIWLMSADGEQTMPVTHNDGGANYISPTWTPDGQLIIFSKRTSNKTRLVQIAIRGENEKDILMPAADSDDDYLGASASPDGRYIYAARRLGWRDPERWSGYWNIVRIDRDNGTVFYETTARLGGTGVRPQISPDGRYLAYGKGNGSYVGLMLRDLRTDEERWLVTEFQRPASWWWGGRERDLMAASVFTPDNKFLLTSYGGKLCKIDINSGKVGEIPFEAEIEQELGPPVRREFPLDDKNVAVRLVSDPALAPEGKRVAFSALDKIWIMDIPNGKPHRLTTSRVGEFQPSWSPDGRLMTYVTWDDVDGGGVWEMASDGSGSPRRLTHDRGYYSNPCYGPDGKHVAVVRGPEELASYGYPGVAETYDHYKRDLGLDILLLSTDGEGTANWGPVDPAAIAADAISHGSLRFGPHGSLYVYDYFKGLYAVSQDGKLRTLELKVTGYRRSDGWSELPRDILLSPDGHHALVRFWAQEVFLLSFDSIPTGAMEVSTATPPRGVRVERISDFGGDYTSWDVGGDAGIIGLGPSMFLVHPAEGAQNATISRIDVDIALASARPPNTEVKVLRGAKVITMRGDEVIDRADILVRGNRVVGVGQTGAIPVPSGSEVVDLSGATIVPGFLDIHNHINPPDHIHPSNDWKLRTLLGYGVTTIRDPHTGSPDLLTYADRISLGDTVGPRVFTTLMPLKHDRRLGGLDDMRAYVRSYAEFYGTENIKNKMNRGRRTQQLLAIAAREAGLLVDNESFNDTSLQLTYILDGFVGLEHNFPIIPLYDDVLHLMAASGEYQTFTLTSEAGDAYYLRQYDYLRVLPPVMFQFYSPLELKILRSDPMRIDYAIDPGFFREIAQQPARLVAAGGRIGMGSHGDIQGIGYHFEMWAHSLGGMKNHDVLRAATLWSAEAIGHGKDLGSIEAGKLADFVVLDANPLDDIHNTLKLRYVVKNGRFYRPFSDELLDTAKLSSITVQ